MFGGQEDGNIGLLFSNNASLSMPFPCPAHDGHVIKLIGSCDPILFSTNQEVSLATNTLVSYGSDNMLNVWVLCIERQSTLILRPQMCLLMDLVPRHFKLLSSTVYMTLSDHSLVSFPTHANWKTENKLVATSCSFSKLQLQRHQFEDKHTDKILSLEASTELGLLVTCSRDGCIKVWCKDNNHLVSEMFFNKELRSACFLNPKGNLLVGFHRDIRVIQAEDYLPTRYVEIGRSFPDLDVIESQIPFDPDLQFWYDTERIPSLPTHQEERHQYLQSHPSKCNLHIPLTASSVGSFSDGSGGRSVATSNKSLQSRVDSSLARELSQQYFMDQKDQRPAAKIRQLIPHQVIVYGKLEMRYMYKL